MVKDYFIKFYIQILLIVLVLSQGCTPSRSDIKMLSDAQILYDSIPEQSLKSLLAIKHIERFSDREQADYCMLLTKLWIDTRTRPPTDSLINRSIDIYRHLNDSSKLAEAIYIKSRYLYSFAQYDSTIFYCNQLFPYLSSSEEDNNIRIYALRLLGVSYFYQGNFSESIGIYHQMVEIKVENRDSSYAASELLALAKAYYGNKETRRAIEISLRSLVMAKRSSNIVAQRNAMQLLSDIYLKEEDYEEALIYKRMEHALRMSRKEVPSRNLATAIIYDKMNNPDSARYFLELAIKGNDFVVADIAYGMLGEWYSKQGEYEEAYNKLDSRDLTTRYITSEISSTTLRHEYEREKLLNENNELKIRQSKKNITLLAVSLMAVVIISIFSFIVLRQKRVRLKQENQLLKQRNEISALREKESSLRESLVRRIHLFERIPSLNQSDMTAEDEFRTKRNSKIMMSDDDWDELIRSVDDLYPNFSERIKSDYPELTVDDVRFCCFLKIKVALQDLSDIYCVSKSAITKRKYRIKTEKLGISDNTIDLDSFLRGR